MTPRFCSLLLLAGSISLTAAAESPAPSPTPGAHVPMQFDSFIVVLLVRPPNAPEFAKETLEEMQKAHLANINRLAKEGKLLKAGPLEDYSGRNVRGIFILTTDSQETARDWIKEDALIKAGRLVPEFMKWYVEKGSLK